MARLRRDAVPKFRADAARMFFTRDALEQASDPLIRKWRTRNPSLNFSSRSLRSGEGLPEKSSTDHRLPGVLDACCGIGSDSLSYARTGAAVTGIDLDPVRVRMAELNAESLRLHAKFVVGDVRDAVPADSDLIFFDPGRREEGRRIYDVEKYQPPLSTVKRWRAFRVLVKLSPGVQLDQLTSYNVQYTEFISVDGDLKEALGYFRTNDYRDGGEGGGHRLYAVLLQADGQYHILGKQDIDLPSIAEPRGWLCEPDPAVIRAGLVQQVAHECGGTLLDETIAYFTTDTKPDTPWARAWRIEAWMPFNVKRLREYLRVRGVGRVTVKKRGTAVTPDVLIPQLKLKGDGERLIVLTRLRGQQIALVCGA
jgi:SAM-dependent methyltransferase